MTFHALALSETEARFYFWVLFLMGVFLYAIVSRKKNRDMYDREDLWLVLFICCIACMAGAFGLLLSYGFIPSLLPVASPDLLFLK